MKRTLLLVIWSILTISIYAQVPQGISHQATIRNSDNELITSSPIGLRVSILPGSVEGIPVYVETHHPTSNSNGLITYVIGSGTVVSGVFSDIDWTSGIYFLKTEVDPLGGTDYVISGATQFRTVPFAFHAETAESFTETDPVYSADPAFSITDAGSGAVITDAERTKLGGIADGAEVNVQSNWTEADNGNDAYIANKPTLFTNSDETDPVYSADPAASITDAGSGAVITDAERTKLGGIADGAEVNVQSNWTEADNTNDAYIANKPTLFTNSDETDPVVGAVDGIIKADGAGTISPAVEGTDYSLLPDQTGNSGKYLGTDGSSASWQTAAGGDNWTLTGSDISNANAGNVGIGVTNPIYDFSVSQTLDPAIEIGPKGGFNKVASGKILFAEDVNFLGSECGFKFLHNGAQNNLYIVAGCSTPDTITKWQRSGWFNVKKLGVGSISMIPTNPLSVVGNSDFTGDMTINGNLNITGNLAKGSGSFKIDHPLDPENKYLIHSFVESPEMMNLFSGNITTDNNGLAYVQMPDYFEDVNRDFRYQLTVIGTFAQAIIKEKIRNNVFVIQTNEPNVEVSWSVTSVRSDKFAQEYPILPEVEKELKGTYLHPELYGQGKDRSEFETKVRMARDEVKVSSSTDYDR